MATIKRLTKTRWYLPDPTDSTKRVETRAGTPGAVKVTEQGTTYYVVWKEGGKTRREATGLTDKRAAQAYLARWLQARERGAVGLTDPYKEHLDRPLAEHLDDYLRTIQEGTHKREVSRVLRNVIASQGVVRLRDLTADRVNDYLTAHPASHATRVKHRIYLSGFTTWLFKVKRRTPENIISSVPVPTARNTEPTTRVRRSYTLSELQSLMQAARTYPIAARTVNKGGRPRRDGQPAQPRKPVELKQEYRDLLLKQGIERELLYRLLLNTGLRRGELSRVKVGMFNGASLVVPKQLLKRKPPHVTHLVFPLAPTLAADLTTFLEGRNPQDRLLNVPCPSNLIREHQARLRLAGIPYLTDDGAVDIHAFRTTMNMILKRKRIKGQRVEDWERKRALRHAAKGVTDRHYDPDNRQPKTQTNKVFRIMSWVDRRIISEPNPS